MTTIYVTSTQNFSGKSAVCVGLLRRFQRDGFSVGYMKPVSTSPRIVGDRQVDEDALFVKSTLGLTDPIDTMAPVILSDHQVAKVLAGEEPDFAGRVREAFAEISKGKDIMVLEGGGSLREGWIVNLAPPMVAEMLDCKELVVVPFNNDLQCVDDLITARVRLGDSMLGAIVNNIPRHRGEFVVNEVKAFADRHGVPLFAILPRKRVLLSVSVAELRDGLAGEVLCAHHAVNELVEHLMVGAMSVDSALTYFRRKPNKAVITGGDRTDIQLAALETSTRCLILTGNLRPSPLIIGRAEEAGVPIILTHHDTMAAIELIENFFGKTRFHQEKKVQRFEALLDEYMDFAGIYAALGLSPRA